MARMGAIKPLVELLAMTNPIDVQAMAALAITEISRSNFKNQSSSAEQGAVSFLVSQCRSTQEGSEPVKAEAAGAIWVMSQGHPSNKVAFAEAGSTKPLVQLLATGNGRAQEHAAHALASLGFDNEPNQREITEQLVLLLGNGATDAKSRAAASLWRLVQENPSSQRTIAMAGSASDLIKLLKEGTREAKAYALWSLSLSINEDNQATLLEEDGVQPLVDALKDEPANAKDQSAADKSKLTRQQAAAAISLLALNNTKAQEAIAAAGGIPPLIRIMEPTRADTMEAREFAAFALADISLVSKNRDEVVACQGIVPIVSLLNEGENNGKKAAAAALARLAAGHTETAADIAGVGAIPLLVALLSGAHGDGAQEEGAGALYQLAENANNRLSITEAGGIGPLVLLLGSTNLSAREHAEGALVRLSIENANRVLIIKKLVSMLTSETTRRGGRSCRSRRRRRSPTSRATPPTTGTRSSTRAASSRCWRCCESTRKAKENAISAITQLAYARTPIQNAIAKAGGIPLARRRSSTQARSNVKDWRVGATSARSRPAIAQLAEGNRDNQRRIAEAGAIPPLVAMLGSPNPEHAGQRRARALGALAGQRRQPGRRRAHGCHRAALRARARGSRPRSRSSRRAHLVALHDNAPNKATVAKLGGIEPLVGLLVAGGTDRSHERLGGRAGGARAQARREPRDHRQAARRAHAVAHGDAADARRCRACAARRRSDVRQQQRQPDGYGQGGWRAAR